MEWWLGHAGRVAAPAPLFFAWQPACSCGMLDCAVPGHIHGDMVGDRVCMKKDNNENYIVIENYNDTYNDNGNGNGNDNNEN